MGITLEQFAKECHDFLKAENNSAGRKKIADRLKDVLQDKEFTDKYLGPDNQESRKILYEDPEFGFCILAHVHLGPKSSKPHDHGHSWAIYGQVKGETHMTEYKKLKDPEGDRPGLVEPTKSYSMKPGDAVFYDIGDLHAPERDAETRLIRIEGTNMDNVKRDAFRTAA